jgi:leucyl/phenylalanyl-tRNA--protein transferase
MRGCASPDRPGGWINERFISAYVELHRRGWAHSFEVFDEYETLVGGLYGVRIGRFFAGESMFHLTRDASKVALMHLVSEMKNDNMTLLDVQWLTPHLESLGALEIPRPEYLHRLSVALNP